MKRGDALFLTIVCAIAILVSIIINPFLTGFAIASMIGGTYGVKQLVN